MLGTGEGLAILGVCGTVITAMVKFVPSRQSPQPTNGHAPVTKEMCRVVHMHLDREIMEIKNRQVRMEKGITKLLIHAGLEEK